jgi:hypothetical protein
MDGFGVVLQSCGKVCVDGVQVLREGVQRKKGVEHLGLVVRDVFEKSRERCDRRKREKNMALLFCHSLQLLSAQTKKKKKKKGCRNMKNGRRRSDATCSMRPSLSCREA